MNNFEDLQIISCGEIINFIAKFDKNKLYSTFFIKENIKNINKILEDEIIEIKGLFIYKDKKINLALLFKLSNSNKFIYGRLYDKNIKEHKENLEILIFQDILPIVFITENNHIHLTSYIENDFKDAIKSYLFNKNISNNIVFNDYRDVNTLWKAF